jgi:integrase
MKRPDLPYVRCVKGKYWYFVKERRVIGKLPNPKDPDFLTVYNRYRQGKHVKPVKQSFAKLIELYVTTHEFTKLAASSQRIYRRRLDYFRDVIGHMPVKAFKPYMLREMQDALIDTPAEANARKAVLNNLFRCGMDYGWIDRNPIEGTRQLVVDPQSALAWPIPLREIVEARTTGTMRLFYEIALATGQRGGDVVKMRWSDIEGDAIRVKQEKTGTRLWLPITPRLAKVLAATPRTGIFILEENGPVPIATIRKRFRKLLDDLEAQDYRLHGLRSTAAQELAEAGLSDEMIMSVTGHKSAASLRTYTGDARQKARAKNAMSVRKGG